MRPRKQLPAKSSQIEGAPGNSPARKLSKTLGAGAFRVPPRPKYEVDEDSAEKKAHEYFIAAQALKARLKKIARLPDELRPSVNHGFVNSTVAVAGASLEIKKPRRIAPLHGTSWEWAGMGGLKCCCKTFPLFFD